VAVKQKLKLAIIVNSPVCKGARFIADYESISEVINSRHAAFDGIGKSMTLPRNHPFKVPQVPVRTSSVDGKSEVFSYFYA